ncbi:hypothetical protein MBT84_49110 [Streptomyces sp. MBT84]|nr:hypothetical protein [Streptomyces sp. MBT84]
MQVLDGIGHHQLEAGHIGVAGAGAFDLAGRGVDRIHHRPVAACEVSRMTARTAAEIQHAAARQVAEDGVSRPGAARTPVDPVHLRQGGAALDVVPAVGRPHLGIDRFRAHVVS